MPLPSCTGVVLAGGESTRFGGLPKGLLSIGRRRLLDRVFDALRPVCDRLLLSANAPDAGGWAPGVAALPDPRPERGSLVGIHAALAHAGGAVLVVAWDMPFVRAPLLAALRAVGEADDAAAVPQGPRGLEPTCAYYPAWCRAEAERQLDAGRVALREFVRSLPRLRVLPPGDVERFGDPDVLFTNVNSRDDLAAAERALDILHHAPPHTIPPSPSESR